MDFKKFFKTFPFVLALLIIPMTMRLNLIDIPYDVQLHWKGTSVDPDIFSYSKSVLLIISAVIIAVILFFSFTMDTFIKVKKLKPFFIAFGVLLLTAIVSAFFGGNSVIAFGGAPSRYEGLYTYIAYFFIFLYAVTLDYDKTTEHIIVISLAFFTVACFIVGTSQFLMKDIFLTNLGQLYYIPDSLKQYRGNMDTTKMNFRNMYIFTTHYNYSSMITAMLSMFWSSYTIFNKEKQYRIISAIMSALSIFMLLGTNGRSGIVAVVVAFVIMFIIFFKNILKNKKVAIGIIISIVLIVFGASSFGLMSRFSALVDDIKKIDVDSNKGQEYIRSQIPLKDIKLTDTTYEIIYDGFTLFFDKTSGNFYDENKKQLSFKDNPDRSISFIDPRYAGVTLLISSRKSNIEEGKTNLYHVMNINGSVLNIDVTDKIKLTNNLGIEIFPEKATRIGFKGMEKLGSGRGFITASTLPLILKSPIIGYGPDAFLQVFNQDDIYTKMYVYGNPAELVDKPHNLYLLYAINFGLIGAFAFLFLVIYLVVRAVKRYKNIDVSNEAFFISAMALVITYMSSGFFNDSTVSVSPVFWAMLGIAISKIGEKE